MQIHPHIHLAFSGVSGIGLTDDLDCNAYLLHVGEGFALFDSGAGRAPDAFRRVLDNCGIAARDLKWLFLTHGHADHAGGAAWLRDEFDVEVFAGEETARMVGSGDEAAISLDRARNAGVYPADYRFRRCPVDGIVQDRHVLSLGSAQITPIATPGHSHDHFSFLVEIGGENVLISGDAVFCDGCVALQDIYDCNVSQVCDSIRKLAQYEFDLLLPGHLRFALKDGRRHLEPALDAIGNLCCPRSIV